MHKGKERERDWAGRRRKEKEKVLVWWQSRGTLNWLFLGHLSFDLGYWILFVPAAWFMSKQEMVGGWHTSPWKHFAVIGSLCGPGVFYIPWCHNGMLLVQPFKPNLTQLQKSPGPNATQTQPKSNHNSIPTQSWSKLSPNHNLFRPAPKLKSTQTQPRPDAKLNPICSKSDLNSTPTKLTQPESTTWIRIILSLFCANISD